MKKIMTVVFAAVAAVAMAQESATPANGVVKAKAGNCVAKVATDEGVDGMKSAIAAEMQNMSAADQVAFIAALNEAIEGLPASEGDKDAYFAAANDAAMQNAAEGNLAKVMAAIFTTVPAESLPAVSDALGKTMNENAKAAGDNKQSTIIVAAKNAVKEVESSSAGSDNADARKNAVIAVFAGIEGAPSNLAELMDNPEAATVAAQNAAANEAAGQQAESATEAAQVQSSEVEIAPDVPVLIPSAASYLGVLSEANNPAVNNSNPNSSSPLSSMFSSTSTINAGSNTEAADSTHAESSGYFGQQND